MSKTLSAEVGEIIRSIRGEKVIIDADLAQIYGVTTRRLNEAVSRNLDRFPPDFRFQLTSSEWQFLRSQTATSKSGSGGKRKMPWVFTEHGAIMAANVLRSDRAVQMSVFVVRAFIKMRNTLSDTTALAAKLETLEREVTSRLDSQEKAIVELMQQFFSIINPPEEEKYPEEEKREMGFHVREEGGRYRVRRKRK